MISQTTDAEAVSASEIGAALWLAGIFVMAVYSAASLYRLRRRLAGASETANGVLVCGAITTPFVIGIIKPKIYLPAGLNDQEREYILRHERSHIRRGDHIVKLVAFAALCVHWFNPLAWVAFVLMSRDMESSCDERVIAELGDAVKADYSASLLRLAAKRSILNGAPLAFGEGDTRGRVKKILDYKRPRFWVIVGCAALVIALAIALACNPENSSIGIIGGADGPTSIFVAEKGDESQKELFEAALYAKAAENKNGEKAADFFVATSQLLQSAGAGDRLRLYGWSFCEYFDISDDGRTVTRDGGYSVPCAVELQKGGNGEYSVTEYFFPSDGSEYEPSIRDFCVNFDGVEIKGLAERLMSFEPKQSGLDERHETAVQQYIKENLGGFTEKDGGYILDVPASASAPAPIANEGEPKDFIMPVAEATVSRPFTEVHRGMDFVCEMGAPIYASASGVVVTSEYSNAGHGNYVAIEHADGRETLYSHNKENLVKVGDSVKQGDIIALVGSTGNSTGPHLHFEIQDENGEPIDPAPLLYE